MTSGVPIAHPVAWSNTSRNTPMGARFTQLRARTVLLFSSSPFLRRPPEAIW
jgi:hypothetical protein